MAISTLGTTEFNIPFACIVDGGSWTLRLLSIFPQVLAVFVVQPNRESASFRGNIFLTENCTLLDKNNCVTWDFKEKLNER